MDNARNARFWIWINGDWVKLTIKPGQRLEHYTSEAHEEGWSSEGNTWTHEGTHVVSTVDTDGSDCDGRMSWGCTVHCGMDYLAAHREENEVRNGVSEWRPPRPEWERGEEFRRDYQAEAAGY
jgi:hypothetical protein